MKTKILSKSWAGCYRKMGTSESTGDVRLDSPRVCGSAGERAQRLVAREQRCSVSAGHSRGARRAKDAGKGLQRGKAGGRGTRSCATAAAGLGWDQMGRDGTGPNGMGRDRMEWDRMEWGGTGLDGMGWDRMGWDGMKWDGTGRDGMGWDGMGPDRTGLGGTGQNGMDRMGWDGMGRNGTGQDGTRWDGTEQDRVGWRGTEWDGMGTESDGMGQDRTGAEGRPAGCRAAAGEWRWSQATPRCWSGGAAPMGARSLPERTRARAETSARGSGRASWLAVAGLEVHRSRSVFIGLFRGCVGAVSRGGVPAGLCPAADFAIRVRPGSTFLWDLSGSTPSHVSPGVISRKLCQCKHPGAVQPGEEQAPG